MDEKDSFILEAAHIHGATTNDDLTEYRFTPENLVKFVNIIIGSTICVVQKPKALPGEEPPDEEALRLLWQIVCIQDGENDASAFLINWLAGAIKIPQCVKDRIYFARVVSDPKVILK